MIPNKVLLVFLVRKGGNYVMQTYAKFPNILGGDLESVNLSPLGHKPNHGFRNVMTLPYSICPHFNLGKLQGKCHDSRLDSLTFI